MTKLVYHGSFWEGSTALQRLKSFQNTTGLTAVGHGSTARMGDRVSLFQRIRWRLGWPVDTHGENESLIAFVVAQRPDMVLIDNDNIFKTSTLRKLRRLGVKKLAYYTPDDVFNGKNLKWPLKLELSPKVGDGLR